MIRRLIQLAKALYSRYYGVHDLVYIQDYWLAVDFLEPFSLLSYQCYVDMKYGTNQV